MIQHGSLSLFHDNGDDGASDYRYPYNIPAKSVVTCLEQVGIIHELITLVTITIRESNRTKKLGRSRQRVSWVGTTCCCHCLGNTPTDSPYPAPQ